tara:strand:- start:68 stop:334 length:267 start_codon:yes stop_codon:yes gene_type:complete
MKEHDTLEELLYSYNEYLNKDLEHDNISVTEMAADNFLECNSLALGKQKPLAKNKECDNPLPTKSQMRGEMLATWFDNIKKREGGCKG